MKKRIAIIPKENEKSEPFSNRKQVRIFLVWWARVDYASRASKKAPQGLFSPPDCSAGRCCSNPPTLKTQTFCKQKTASVSLRRRSFYGRGWIAQAALLKTAHWAVFVPSSATGPQLFESTRMKTQTFCKQKTASVSLICTQFSGHWIKIE